MKLFRNFFKKTEYKTAKPLEYGDKSTGREFRIKSYYNYFFSYFIIILILIIISTVTYVYAVGMMRESAIAENRGYMSAVKYDGDEIAKQLMTSAMEASFDDSLKEFCKVGREEIEANDLLLYSAMQAFSAYGENLGEEGFFFSGKSDMILGFEGARSTKEFLRENFAHEDIAKIETHLKSDEKAIFMPAKTAQGNQRLMFFCNMNELRLDGRIGKVVSVIDINVLTDILKTAEKSADGAVCYVQMPEYIINAPKGEVHDISSIGSSRSFFIEETGQDVVTAYNSKITNWRYVCVTPQKAMFKNSNTMLFLVVVNIIMMFLLGLAATMLLVRQNMKPLKKLVTVLEDMGLKTSGVKNEFDFIQNVVSAVVREKEEIGEIVYKQNKALKMSFLQNLIRGRIVGGDEFKASLKAFGINLVSNSFAVGVFYIKDIDSLFKEEQSLDVSEKQRMASIIMGNILEELIGKHHMGFVVEVSDMQVCLVNVSRERAAFFYSDMEEAVSVARENIKKYFSIDFSASFGNVY